MRYLHTPLTASQIDLDYWCDSCEHVIDGSAPAVASYSETDSFGPVVRAYYCEACAAEAEKHPLTCEWCGETDNTVETRPSCDSGDWYCICSKCNRTKNTLRDDD